MSGDILSKASSAKHNIASGWRTCDARYEYICHTTYTYKFAQGVE